MLNLKYINISDFDAHILSLILDTNRQDNMLCPLLHTNKDVVIILLKYICSIENKDLSHYFNNNELIDYLI